MRQCVYLLSTKLDSIEDVFLNKIYKSNTLTEDILVNMAKNCFVDYFYVISTNTEITFPVFDFTFKPEIWDSNYIHIWNNDFNIRLFNKDLVLKTPNKFIDLEFKNGNVKTKNISENIFRYTNFKNFDIIFLSYDEKYATIAFEKLRNRFPKVKHISGIKGIYEAHKECAKISETSMFYVVDSDAEVLDTFNFDYIPLSQNFENVHVWHSKNPINDLEYGYGAVKLFPKNVLLNSKLSSVDFTTSVSENTIVIPEISNVTQFNVDEFSTWRSAFRECTKLSTRIIKNQNTEETEERLRTWCTRGAGRPFGEFAICGARAGAEFGKLNSTNMELLKLINDYDWLWDQFQQYLPR